jgi:hypothetical protein
LLDESEIEGMNGAPVEMKSDLIDSYVPPPPAPVPSSAPATEVFAEYATNAQVEEMTRVVKEYATNPNPPFEIQAKIETERAAVEYSNKPTEPVTTMDQITARLNTYRRDVLQRGGMRPAKGLGIAAKWEKFRARKIAEKTVEEYAKLLSELDAVLAKSGDVGVVAFIEKEIA